jgi:protocatechuate 3,4-dioxygenase beta subunit
MPAAFRGRHDQDNAMDDHDKGLAHDLDTLGRRRVLLGAAGLAAVTLATAWGCGGGSSSTSDASSGTTGTTGTTGSGSTPTGTCVVSAEETEGPYPADGSNSIAGTVSNALALTGIVRSDIRTSFGSMSGTAAGVPTTLVNAGSSCAALSGYAVYVWHCDRDGEYSLYGASDQNYLRGVQETDTGGAVTFTTIFPACYAGRMPHIHIEVYRSTTTATSYANKLKTTQLALPTDVCETVYTTATGYSASVANFAQISFATDNVFSDGTSTEMSAVTGSVADGYTVSLQVGISV